jgi:hypothetical protein
MANRNLYSVADISNFSIASDITALDVSSTAYEPGDEFIVYAEGGGDVVVTTRRGTEVTIAIGDNQYLVCLVTKLDTTGNGTTATGLFAFRK